MIPSKNTILLLKKCTLNVFSTKVVFGGTMGTFHSTKIPVWNFKIQLAQWSCTFRLHRPDPSHRAFGYCSCKQDTKERYREKQFGQMERDISVRPTEITGPVKVHHLQSWSRIFRSDQTEMVCSIWCTNQNFRNFELKEKRPVFASPTEDWTAILRVLQATWRSSRLQCKGSTFISELFQDREYWSGPGNRAGNLPLSSQALYRLS